MRQVLLEVGPNASRSFKILVAEHDEDDFAEIQKELSKRTKALENGVDEHKLTG